MSPCASACAIPRKGLQRSDQHLCLEEEKMLCMHAGQVCIHEGIQAFMLNCQLASLSFFGIHIEMSVCTLEVSIIHLDMSGVHCKILGSR